MTTSAYSSTTINLSWSASTDNVGVTGYRVERCQGATCCELRSDRHTHRDNVQRHRARGQHDLPLSGAGDGCGRQLSAYSAIATATTTPLSDSPPR